MRWVYAGVLGLMVGYIGHEFHWSTGVRIGVTFTVITFAYFVARIVTDDMKD